MSAIQSERNEVNAALAELEDIFNRRCKVNNTGKPGSVSWTKAQLEFVIAAATGARLAGNEAMGNALLIRATLFAAFGRNAFERFGDASGTPLPGNEALAAGSEDGASHSG